jgi:hypothetical protein
MPRQLLPTAQTGPNNHIYNMWISFSMLATATDLSVGLATRQLAHRTISDQRSDKEQQGNSNRVLANVRVFSRCTEATRSIPGSP